MSVSRLVKQRRAAGARYAATRSEAGLQRQIVDAGEKLGYLVYHTKNSLMSDPGFPDLVLLNPLQGSALFHAAQPRVIFAELKGPKGVLSPMQERYGEVLNEAVAYWQAQADSLGQALPFEYYVWRWEDWDNGDIVRILAGRLAA